MVTVIFLTIFILFWIALSFYGEWKVAKGDLEREKKKHEEEIWNIREKYRSKEWK